MASSSVTMKYFAGFDLESIYDWQIQIADSTYLKAPDLTDIAILSFMEFSSKIFAFPDGWFRISPKYVEEKFPVLQLKEKQIRRRMNNLVEIGYLEKKTLSAFENLGNTCLYRFTELYRLMKAPEIEKNNSPESKAK